MTKFRLEPAFYSVEVNVLVNLDTWKGLNDAQRKVLSDAAAVARRARQREHAAINGRAREADQGRHSADRRSARPTRKAFLAKANDVAWQSVIKTRLETGAKLRQLAGN